MGRMRSLWVLFGLVLCTVSIYDFNVSADVIVPSENECRPYIEKAIHELKNVDATVSESKESTEENMVESATLEPETLPETGTEDETNDSIEENPEKSDEDGIVDEENQSEGVPSETAENVSVEEPLEEPTKAPEIEATVERDESEEKSAETEDSKEDDDSKEKPAAEKNISKEESSENEESKEEKTDDVNASQEQTQDDSTDSQEAAEDANISAQTEENQQQDSPAAEPESEQANDESNEESTEVVNEQVQMEDDTNESADVEQGEAQKEEPADDGSQETQNDTQEESAEETVRAKRSLPDTAEEENSEEKSNETTEVPAEESVETTESIQETSEGSQENVEITEENVEISQESAEESQEVPQQSVEEDSMPEEDLTMEFEIPKNLRPHGHVSELLGLDAESSIKENALKRTGDVILKELKRIYDNSVRPLESMYKYRDLSNRHFGDPEIFSKPLILFMGPWSGGKSTILNYLTENEYTPHSIRSGAEPSPAYFNIMMHGDEPEVLDGTQLAADWTFSGLQKFGQGLNDRLRGQKLPSKLLERVNIVEIPGILEVRKQVSRYFPFNDACQWFIDRADIIFLVYDPSKLDVGPETEAILDQLKGREYQTRILLNKADQVKPEELLRVQGALIWNISPLMSSAQPPVMYTVSLWSHPFEAGAPVRLLQAQEKAFLIDLREAIDRRIENKIASARRFAVRIRNHAKMVDCYLTTYYNQKSLFSNKKQVSDKIIEHPQNYNIYEGLSTLTNISRYDLPDPEVYLDFFRLNPLYNFKKLSETCTYFKGCPINKLDIAIAYDLPELVGKYKKLLEQNLAQLRKEYDENCNQTEPQQPVKIIKSR